MNREQAIRQSIIAKVHKQQLDIYDEYFKLFVPDHQFWTELDAMEVKLVSRPIPTRMKANAFAMTFLRDYRELCVQACRREKLARGRSQASGKKAARKSGRKALPASRRPHESRANAR